MGLRSGHGPEPLFHRMRRTRLILGFVAGAFLLLSACAHSLLGWKSLSGRLAENQIPADLMQALAIGWHFGGVAMVAFGLIAILSFVRYRKNERASLAPVTIISLAYLAFGAFALVATQFDPFFLIFIVPGLMLLAASWRKAGDPIWDA